MSLSSSTQASLNLVLMYLGRFPNYFPLFLASAAANDTIHWSILTDQSPPSRLPANISWHSFSFANLAERLKSTLGISCRLTHPYKLCDFRPAIGVLYEDLLKGYDFWGHCDCDVVWGNIRRFTPLDKALGPPKIQMRGAFSVYRNDSAGNTLFTLEHPRISYREAFSNARYCGFDEWHGLWKLIKRHSIPYHVDASMAEIDIGPGALRAEGRPRSAACLFSWEQGRLLGTRWDGMTPDVEEFSYMHLQKRTFNTVELDAGDRFYFLPDQIAPLNDASDPSQLARKNSSDPWRLLRFQLGRPRRYIQSLKTVDRSYWRVPN